MVDDGRMINLGFVAYIHTYIHTHIHTYSHTYILTYNIITTANDQAAMKTGLKRKRERVCERER